MKINILRAILIILLLCTFFIIFGFSDQDGETSGGISQKMTNSVLEKSNKYNQLDNKQKSEIFHRVESIIRKTAHFSIYTVVGFLLMWLLCTYTIDDKKKIAIAVIVGILYAASDEFHQSFSPGRSPKITDVYIDTLGVILGILLIMTIREIYNQYMTKRSQKVTKNVV